jgi:hypothetical protein
MPTKPRGSTVQFEVELQFQGVGQEQPPDTSVFVYDANGQFVASSAIQDSRAVLRLPAQLTGQTIRVFVAPRRQASDTPTVADLSWQQAYEWRDRLGDDNPGIRLVVVEPIWRGWLLCPCVITGQLVTTLTLPDGSSEQLPICHSRVNICEVTPLWILLDRLPDPVILQLRDAVLEVARQPPPPPENLAPAVSALALPTSPSVAAAVPSRRPPGSVIGSPVSAAAASAGPAGSTAQDETALSAAAGAIASDKLVSLSLSPSVADIRAKLAEIGPIILPWFCYWGWLEPWLLLNCFETVTTDENGKFFAIIWYPCSGPRPNLYFSAEQQQGSSWVSIYQPPVRCSTYWNFACGSNVVLNVTDPSAIPCAPPPPVNPPDGLSTWVMPTAVGGSMIWGTYPVMPAPAGWVKADGLTDYGSIVNAPFGGYLGLRSGSSIDIPSSSLYYYRWSYRPAGSSGAFTPLSDPVVKHYVKQSPTTLPSFPAYQLGPDTVGAQTDLFQFKPVNPPGPTASDPPGTITYWPTDDFLGDIYSGYWNTLSIPGGVLAAAGEYQVKLEVFDETGTLVDPAAGAFGFIVPDGIGSDGVTILTRAADPSEIDAGGFVFNLHVDNNPCTASIDPADIEGSYANRCGFLGYSDASDPVTLSFHAKHPNNFAIFSWEMVRGLSTLGSLDVTDAEVAAATAGPYTGDGAGDFAANVPASSLLGTCANAAFGEDLYVAAKATTGWGDRISQYDAQALGAFALEQS